jgi:hypothetical protein
LKEKNFAPKQKMMNLAKLHKKKAPKKGRGKETKGKGRKSRHANRPKEVGWATLRKGNNR